MRLVADVGGTNARFGLTLGRGQAPTGVKTYRNDEFGDFQDALRRYLADTRNPDVSDIVLAVAGPVIGRIARLTNRDWIIDADRISAGVRGVPVHLMNDLKALAHAISYLGPNDVATVSSASCLPEGHQSLVVGIGTGFNVSLAFIGGETVICHAAEYGHTSLPSTINRRLKQELPSLETLPTVEDCFSGRGHARLHSAWTSRNPEDRSFPDFYAELLGLLTRDLLLVFMPMAGIYFAGSVARGVLLPDARTRFTETFNSPNSLAERPRAPVFVITNDAAALRGCSALTDAS